jgi:hypothetical protein
MRCQEQHYFLLIDAGSLTLIDRHFFPAAVEILLHVNNTS